ncbi:RagB/SusD family nutrient uptake outer membrane protein [Arenibacter palladensis]|uniref:RagB/SusD family nutrient uptake outer membrane protein n=1 Tax=Arenibacter palladensis TaxID=237373 RepID=UPI0026E28C6E|nr:RagB/SusD family nutrient uptake outer membrane protein [Arenibacter palladensis]MDO6602833.1 RagB/SusD family nutrient uptake outer membrane protein [Arenibacter palladensis]
MKKLVYINILVLIVYSFNSCSENFLDVVPETSLSSESFFNTEDHFISALNATYVPLRNIYKGGNFWLLAEQRSDNTSYENLDGSGTGKFEIDEFRVMELNSFPPIFFNMAYNGIGRANLLLHNLETTELLEADSKNVIEGQALFLRSLYYFHLVRIFGDVPLVLEPVETTDQAFVSAERVQVSEVYELIVNDFSEAASKLPLSYSGNNIGRATKGAALTLLAEVQLTLKNYDSAVEALQNITGYDLLPSYAELWDASNKNSVESIFEVQYSVGLGSEEFASNFMYSFVPQHAGAGEEIIGFPAGNGSDSGHNTPTQDMIDSYEPNDLRKEISIGFWTNPLTGIDIPYVQKFNNPGPFRFWMNDNMPIYRYSDVLLMLSEALNELGYVADGEAFSLLNQVRNRAGLSNLTSVELVDQNSFREAVAHERRVELAFENHRWFDLLRTDKANEIMIAHGEAEMALKTYIPSNSFQNISLLYPYPNRETLLTESNN